MNKQWTFRNIGTHPKVPSHGFRAVNEDEPRDVLRESRLLPKDPAPPVGAYTCQKKPTNRNKLATDRGLLDNLAASCLETVLVTPTRPATSGSMHFSSRRLSRVVIPSEVLDGAKATRNEDGSRNVSSPRDLGSRSRPESRGGNELAGIDEDGEGASVHQSTESELPLARRYRDMVKPRETVTEESTATESTQHGKEFVLSVVENFEEYLQKIPSLDPNIEDPGPGSGGGANGAVPTRATTPQTYLDPHGSLGEGLSVGSAAAPGGLANAMGSQLALNAISPASESKPGSGDAQPGAAASGSHLLHAVMTQLYPSLQASAQTPSMIVQPEINPPKDLLDYIERDLGIKLDLYCPASWSNLRSLPADMISATIGARHLFNLPEGNGSNYHPILAQQLAAHPRSAASARERAAQGKRASAGAASRIGTARGKGGAAAPGSRTPGARSPSPSSLSQSNGLRNGKKPLPPVNTRHAAVVSPPPPPASAGSRASNSGGRGPASSAASPIPPPHSPPSAPRSTRSPSSSGRRASLVSTPRSPASRRSGTPGPAAEVPLVASTAIDEPLVRDPVDGAPSNPAAAASPSRTGSSSVATSAATLARPTSSELAASDPVAEGGAPAPADSRPTTQSSTGSSTRSSRHGSAGILTAPLRRIGSRKASSVRSSLGASGSSGARASSANLATDSDGVPRRRILVRKPPPIYYPPVRIKGQGRRNMRRMDDLYVREHTVTLDTDGTHSDRRALPGAAWYRPAKDWFAANRRPVAMSKYSEFMLQQALRRETAAHDLPLSVSARLAQLTERSRAEFEALEARYYVPDENAVGAAAEGGGGAAGDGAASGGGGTGSSSAGPRKSISAASSAAAAEIQRRRSAAPSMPRSASRVNETVYV
ncbi:hypothetical protein H9P43_005967 [Blastocladiella emersonii ATCC 22665]|nr:hypothetical protein H9P43_005967 [Blastocladiella emersonii ATCC 22665]